MLKKAISWFERHNKISWTITILIAIIIFYLSSLTFEGVSTGLSINSYIYHFSAFFFLSLSLLISLTKGNKNSKLILLGIIIAIVYGISDEVHQLFVPGRACSIMDVITDSLGILFAGILYSFRLSKK